MSLAKLCEASTGLVHWEAIVSTVCAGPALRSQWDKEDGYLWYECISLTCLVLEYQGSAFLF